MAHLPPLVVGAGTLLLMALSGAAGYVVAWVQHENQCDIQTMPTVEIRERPAPTQQPASLPPPTWLPPHGTVQWYINVSPNTPNGFMTFNEFGEASDRTITIWAAHLSPPVRTLDLVLHAGQATEVQLPRGRYNIDIITWDRKTFSQTRRRPDTPDPRQISRLASVQLLDNMITAIHLYDEAGVHAEAPRPARRIVNPGPSLSENPTDNSPPFNHESLNLPLSKD